MYYTLILTYHANQIGSLNNSFKFMRLVFKYAQVIINFMRFNLKNIWLAVFNIVVGHLLWQTISRQKLRIHSSAAIRVRANNSGNRKIQR